MRTPWGESDYEKEIAPGIILVQTPSHGGIKCYASRNHKIPEAARQKAAWWANGEPGWYEEDVEAVIPLIVFYNEIDWKGMGYPEGKIPTIEQLKGSLERWNEKALNALTEAGFIPKGENNGSE